MKNRIKLLMSFLWLLQNSTSSNLLMRTCVFINILFNNENIFIYIERSG